MNAVRRVGSVCLLVLALTGAPARSMAPSVAPPGWQYGWQIGLAMLTEGTRPVRRFTIGGDVVYGAPEALHLPAGSAGFFDTPVGMYFGPRWVQRNANILGLRIPVVSSVGSSAAIEFGPAFTGLSETGTGVALGGCGTLTLSPTLSFTARVRRITGGQGLKSLQMAIGLYSRHSPQEVLGYQVDLIHVIFDNPLGGSFLKERQLTALMFGIRQ